MQRRIKFQETEYLLVGGNLTNGGAIATEDEYISGAVGYAHLYEDGIIRRYGQEIGKREDIQDLGPADVKVSEEGKERLYDDMARICLEFMGGTVTRYEDGIIWRSDREQLVTSLGENETLKATVKRLENGNVARAEHEDTVPHEGCACWVCVLLRENRRLRFELARICREFRGEP